MSKRKVSPKIKTFPQSYILDELLSRRILQDAGHKFENLSDPFLYRGDSRDPKEIFENGFYRRIEKKFVHPEIENMESISCVATSKYLVNAIAFAEFSPKKFAYFYNMTPPSHSWVYLVYSKKGVDLSRDEDKERVAEVVLTGVPGEHILAALQIKITKNIIEMYHEDDCYKEFYRQHNRSYHVTWHIPITDFKINEKCIIKKIDPDLYVQKLKQFAEIYEDKYFFIPWIPPHEVENLSKQGIFQNKTKDVEEKVANLIHKLM